MFRRRQGYQDFQFCERVLYFKHDGVAANKHDLFAASSWPNTLIT
jgi:hypothetical protein